MEICLTDAVDCRTALLAGWSWYITQRSLSFGASFIFSSSIIFATLSVYYALWQWPLIVAFSTFPSCPCSRIPVAFALFSLLFPFSRLLSFYVHFLPQRLEAGFCLLVAANPLPSICILFFNFLSFLSEFLSRTIFDHEKPGMKLRKIS